MNILYFVLMMGVIIFVHELGHFITAKSFGVYCHEFALGMGPTVFKKKVGETIYAIRALPVGGFVSMAGEEGTDFGVAHERTIKGIARWKQVIVMVAGSVMNILLALGVLIGIYMVQGQVPVYGQAQIVELQAGGAAELAGVQVGDVITSVIIDGDTIETASSLEFIEQLSIHEKEMQWNILRGEQELSITIAPLFNESENRYYFGISMEGPTGQDIAWYESFGYGAQTLWTQTQQIFTTLANLVQGIGLNNLSGPVGIFNMTSQTAQAGLLPFLSLMGLLSLNIGIFNLLPLPVLDGGRILIVAIEAITRKKMSEKVEMAIMSAGIVLLVGLMLFVTWNDLSRLFGF